MHTTITSASNPTIRLLRSLAQSGKKRRDAGATVAEGAHLAQSFLSSSLEATLYVCSESAKANQEIIDITQQLDDRGVKGVVVGDRLFESFTSVHASVGIAVVITLPTVSQKPRLKESVILLDDVQDPGNLGSILRVAAATGVREVLLSAGCAQAWSPKALRAGMGAQFGLRIHEGVDLVQSVQDMKLPLLVTTLSSSSKSLYDIDLNQPVAWAFGSEGQGVSESLIQLADQHVLIPQVDGPVESLNVAAAAAVCLYEHYRQSHL